jgi:hypothetical protein
MTDTDTDGLIIYAFCEFMHRSSGNTATATQHTHAHTATSTSTTTVLESFLTVVIGGELGIPWLGKVEKAVGSTIVVAESYPL